MKRNIYSIFFIAAMGVQTTAIAETFNYSRISLGYMNQTVEMTGISSDLEASGFELTASFDVNRSFGVQFGLEKASGDTSILGNTVDLDVDAKMLGMFFHAPVARNVDVVLGAAILQGEQKASIGSTTVTKDSLDGQQVSVEVRIMMGKRLEINAGVDLAFIDGDSDSEIMIGASGYLTKDINLGVSYSSGNDSQATLVSVSKYF